MKTLPAVIIALVVVAAAGCAGGGETVSMEPAVDVAGKWVGDWVGTIRGGTVVTGGQGTVEMMLTQTGSQATGDLRVTGMLLPYDPSGPIQVTLSGNTVNIIQPSKLTGTLTVQGDRMSGHVLGGSMQGNVTLQRQK